MDNVSAKDHSQISLTDNSHFRPMIGIEQAKKGRYFLCEEADQKYVFWGARSGKLAEHQ